MTRTTITLPEPDGHEEGSHYYLGRYNYDYFKPVEGCVIKRDRLGNIAIEGVPSRPTPEQARALGAALIAASYEGEG